MKTIVRLYNHIRKMNQLLYQSVDSSLLLSQMDNLIDDNLTLTTSPLDTTIDSPTLSSINLSYSFQFWFYLSFEIPSIIGYLFIFICIFAQKTQRQALHNHSTIAVLLVAFTMVLLDCAWSIDSFHHEGKIWLATPALCLVWLFIDFGCFSSCTVIIAWISFERHILIFHSHLLSTKRKRLFLHYLPLIFILLYLAIFYIYVIFFPPCENEYDFTLTVCGGGPCYLTITYLAMWDTIVHGIIPTFLIVLLNIALLVRVIWQRRSLHRRQDWKIYQKMAFELFSIAALYLTVNLPFMIILFVQLLGYPDWCSELQRYIFFFSFLIPFLLPFICAAHLPGKWLTIKTFVLRHLRHMTPVEKITITNGR